MKLTVKLVLQYLLYGISLGCTSFVIMCLGFFVGGGEDFLAAIFKDFARQSIGAIMVGIACGSTAIIYQLGRFSESVKMAIHFCIGMGVFYPIAIYLGWIPFYPDNLLFTIMQFMFSCGIFMAIRFCFYLFYRKEARKINERLKEIEKDDEFYTPPTST